MSDAANSYSGQSWFGVGPPLVIGIVIFVAGINGSYTNIVGLCVHAAEKMLAAAYAHAAALKRT